MIDRRSVLRSLTAPFAVAVGGCATPRATQIETNLTLNEFDYNAWPQRTTNAVRFDPETALTLDLKTHGEDDAESVHATKSARTLIDLAQCIRHSESDSSVYAEASRRYAERFVDTAATGPQNGLYFPYDFDFPLHGDEDELLTAPWYSGMGQGIALSAFARLAHLTDDQYYYGIADRIWTTLATPRPSDTDDPWVVTIEDGQYWIEEYPIHPPAHTLNGKLFAVWGLYEYWRVTDRETVKNHTLAAMDTISKTIDDFRVPGDVSLYCLKHEVQDESYHHTHIIQLDDLYHLTGYERFAEYRDAFRDDFDPK
ncbi:D-glucuronyl C5-epimerase family protein [Halosolutus gelatinilyticus]|uniref:D-glucuronyl C5-epimerase family protein n=1 Tax=Halosolutus gelatinilyticus TaxID=2931975 RepID=UPI001FF17F86|nr:D-glucuronyl C5-epimerase family protein [Halosolutus gelatinilyticus]